MKKILFLITLAATIFSASAQIDTLYPTKTLSPQSSNIKIVKGLQIGNPSSTDTLINNGKFIIPDDAGAGKILTSDANGLATWQYQPEFATEPNRLVSGGIVTWLSGYIYNISAATYWMNGVLYSSPSTNDTLSAADATDDRIDLFVLTTSSTATTIEGTPSTPPASPDYDANTQLQIAFATVTAASTAPTIAVDWIYRENADWTTAVSAGTIVANSASNPYAGSVDVEGTNVANNTYITFTADTAPAMSLYSILSFQIRSKANFGTTKKLLFRFYNGTTPLGVSVPLGSGSYGFISTNTTSYQAISIPLSDFGNVSGATVLRITQSNTSGTQGWYLDNIQLQNSASVVQSASVPYKSYVALLNQTGTSDPVATVVQNEVGNIVWTRGSVGNYVGTLSGAFILGKTILIITQNGNAEIAWFGRNSDNELYLQTANGFAFGSPPVAFIDGGLSDTSIEIRIYP